MKRYSARKFEYGRALAYLRKRSQPSGCEACGNSTPLLDWDQYREEWVCGRCLHARGLGCA